jgi:hypothetical protein
MPKAKWIGIMSRAGVRCDLHLKSRSDGAAMKFLHSI